MATIDGKLLKKGVSNQEINLSDMPNGLYFFKIEKQGRVFIEKIVIEK